MPREGYGHGKKLNELGFKTTRLEEHGFSIDGIREWRLQEYEAGRRSSLEDFDRIHGICRACSCYGLQMTGWDEESAVPLWTICTGCGGSGRVVAEFLP